MSDIVTVTMNPALDIAASADRVEPTVKIRCSTPQYDPGGGGVNVARALHVLGADVLAVFPAGGATGDEYERLVRSASLAYLRVPIAGSTRESFAVTERDTSAQYRFVLPGPRLTEDELRVCFDTLGDAVVGAKYVVASGSLPPGVPVDFYQRVADVTRAAGARLVLDTSGEALRHTRSGVFLLKPSIRELRNHVGAALATRSAQIAAARALIGEGRCEVVVVSLGADGALAVTESSADQVPAIPVRVCSGVGAGDNLVAGIVYALNRGEQLASAVQTGMATAAASLLTAGTGPCRPADVNRLLSEQEAPQPPREQAWRRSEQPTFPGAADGARNFSIQHISR